MRAKLKPLAYFVMLGIANPGLAFAAPGIPDHQNASGAGVTFNESMGPDNAPRLDVSVSNPNSVINWNGGGFNVAPNGSVNFNSSVGPTSILNYDNSGSRSVIDGMVNNGGNKLFLVNPNGISDSSGAFSALISNDPENVTFGPGGRLRIVTKGDRLLSNYGTVTGNVSNEFDLDIELSNSSGIRNANMMIGGNNTNILVKNQATPMVIDSDLIVLKGQKTTFTSEGGGGSIRFVDLNARNIEAENFADTEITGVVDANIIRVTGDTPSSNTRINSATGSLRNLTVDQGNLSINGNQSGGVLLIDGLSHNGSGSNTTFAASNNATLDIRNVEIELQDSGSQVTGSIGTGGGKILLNNGSISADREISLDGNKNASSQLQVGDIVLFADNILVENNVEVSNLSLRNYKLAEFSGRTTGFNGVSAVAAEADSQFILTGSTGTYGDIDVEGGVVRIDSNVTNGTMTINNLTHIAEVGGTHVTVSGNSNLSLNNIHVNLDSGLDIDNDPEYSTEEMMDAGVTNSFTATAEGIGGTLTIDGGDIIVEKEAQFTQEEGAVGTLTLRNLAILSRSADIELVKNTEFTLVDRGDGEDALIIVSDQNLENTDNKGLVIINDDGIRSEVGVQAPRTYKESEQYDPDVEYWRYSSDSRIVVDWDKVTIDQVDLKESEEIFIKDSNAGGGIPDPGDGSGGIGGNEPEVPTDPVPGPDIDPGTGWPIDPGTGWPIDPETGLPVDPETIPTEPEIDPETGYPIDPGTGWPIDPETGWPIDPETGLPTEPTPPPAIDPETGYPIDPGTGYPIDPGTGWPIDPGTGWPINPDTGLPTDPGTTNPGEPVDPGEPVNPGTGNPIDPETGLPNYPDPETGGGESGIPGGGGGIGLPGDGGDSDGDGSNPTNPTDPTPPGYPGDGPGTTDPTGPGSGGGGTFPTDPGTGNPIDPGTGWPVDPETGWPVDPDTGIPTDPETIDPGTGNPWPIDPESGLPINPETGEPFNPGADDQAKPGAIEGARNWLFEFFFSNGDDDEDEEEKKKKAKAQAEARAKAQERARQMLADHKASSVEIIGR